MILRAQSMTQLYSDISRLLSRNGTFVRARGLSTLELTNMQLILTKPRDRIISITARDIDYRYLVGKLCFFLNGSTKLSDIVKYSKFWNKVSDDGQTVNSAYGYRLFKQKSQKKGLDQLSYVLSVLTEDSSSRKAVMPIYSITDSKKSNDTPCTMFVQFLIRNNKLDCYVTMRSNDVWLGVPYDIAFFTLVQEIVFVKLKQDPQFSDLSLGWYYHTATSLHVYANHVDDLMKVADEMWPVPVTNLPELTDVDVDTWFHALLQYEKTGKQNKMPTAFQSVCKNLLEGMTL